MKVLKIRKESTLLGRPLLPHQVPALEYCRSTPFPALFMEMRLGKTKVVIEWLRSVAKRILVVCPLSTVRASWEEQLRAEGEASIALLLDSTAERMEAFSQKKKWNLINFEGLLRCPSLLSGYRWDAMVLDESTRIKNPKAQITKLLADNADNADRRCILSGFPAPEGPLDYFEQFRFLQGGMLGFKNFWSFRNVAFFTPPKIYKWMPKPSFKPRIRDWVQNHAFIQSRADVGLANQKIYEKRIVRMEPKQRKLMEKLEEEFVLELPNGEQKQTNWVPVKLTWMARLAGGYVDGKTWFEGKFKELGELLKGELKDQQVVVWFRFNAELRHAADRLHEQGISCVGIDGTVDEARRSEIRRDFQGHKFSTLLVQQKVGMFGLDLSAASTTIYFSNTYAAETRVQSEDRIEHPLKKESLLILDLVTEDSPDEDAVKALGKKIKDSDFYLRSKLVATIKRRYDERTVGN